MPSDPRPVFRFAPSPNGELHLGHALSALVGWEAARAAGGRFLLRIEDIDTGRARPEFVAGIFQDLRWLGLDWEEPVLVQSTRFAAYARRRGGWRRKACSTPALPLAPRSRLRRPAGPRTPTARRSIRASGKAAPPRRSHGARPPASRSRCASISTRRWRRANAHLAGAAADVCTSSARTAGRRSFAAEPALWGDAVIVRKDVPASYHLAVVVDDAWQGVSHVTRGRDLYAATHLHRLLQVLLGPAGAALPASSPDHRRRRPQARQERARRRPAIAARSRRDPGRGAAAGWAFPARIDPDHGRARRDREMSAAGGGGEAAGLDASLGTRRFPPKFHHGRAAHLCSAPNFLRRGSA